MIYNAIGNLFSKNSHPKNEANIFMNKISTKILLFAFTSFLILLLISTAMGLKNMSEMNQRMNSLLNNRVVQTDLLQTMRNYARARTMALHHVVAMEDPFMMDEELINFSNLAGKWIKTKDELMTFDLDDNVREMLDKLYKNGGVIAVAQRRVIQLAKENKHKEASMMLMHKVMPEQDKVMLLYDNILTYQKEKSIEEYNTSKSEYNKAVNYVFLITFFLILAGVIIAVYVIRQNHLTGKRIKEDKEKIEYFAFHDVLTGLPNRRLLMDRLQQEVGHSKRLKNCGAVLFIDVDKFKTLNDSLGHKIGDELICQIGERILQAQRTDDTVSRLGGDEFVIVYPAISNHLNTAINVAERMANKTREILSEPYILDKREYSITVSIGITILENGSQSPDELLKFSDAALYEAKNAGRNQVRFYEKSMQEIADRRLSTEQDIRASLSKGHFYLNYQPQVNRYNQLVGIESLVRWQHPDKGIVSPSNFIPIAEESGLIIPLGMEIFDNICLLLQKLEKIELPETFTSVSVNISPKQFAQPDFVEFIIDKIFEYEINPAYLMLEITEGMLLHNIEDIIKKMKKLKEVSVKFSIDDFGTGYSSMQYLQLLPLDELKIDQSFIKDVDTNRHNAAIVETFIAIANNLNLSLVAEGVEKEEQKIFLEKHGCHCYQGYLIEKPITEKLLIEKYFNHNIN